MHLRPLRQLAGYLSLLAVPLLAHSMTAAELLPIEAFFGTDSVRQMALSPDGDRIALIAPNNGRYSLAMLDTKTGKASVIVHLADENIRQFFWKGNDRLLFWAAVEGHEVPMLASVDLTGKSMKRILEPRLREDDFSIYFGNLADRFPNDDENILIFGFAGDIENNPGNINGGALLTDAPPGIYRVNVNTARRTNILQLDRYTDAGYFTSSGQQRLTTLVEGTKCRFVSRAKNDEPWHTLRTFDVTDIGWSTHGLLADGRTAYVVDNTATKYGALHSVDLDTGTVSAPLFVPEHGEIDRLIFTSRRERLLGVVYEDTRERTHWIDPRWAAIGATLEKNFPDQVVSVISISDDEKRFIFLVHSDRDPGRYFLGDLRSDSLQVQLINAVRPAIKPGQMSPMEPIQYTARDGLTIHGYLTKPGGHVGPDVPLLILPHGGPFGIRDSWGFDPMVQFLANRGYSILQVNYRGSGGYGNGFEHAGYGEWGGKMQDDLTDAVQWAIKQGYVDPARVGIIGASYGGYAALAGVTGTPELYRVGINYVGVSDLSLITRRSDARSAASNAVITKMIGNDANFLRDRSPVSHVANIRVPTLHAYGLNDPRVKIENWTELEAALKKYNKTYQNVVVKNEGHGFEKSESSIEFFRVVESFLNKYMPATRSAAASNVDKDKPATSSAQN